MNTTASVWASKKQVFFSPSTTKLNPILCISLKAATSSSYNLNTVYKHIKKCTLLTTFLTAFKNYTNICIMWIKV